MSAEANQIDDPCTVAGGLAGKGENEKLHNLYLSSVFTAEKKEMFIELESTCLPTIG